MERRKSGVSAVVPVYNGMATVPELVSRLERVLGGVAGGFEIILVNDGSPDESWATIRRLAEEVPHVTGIDLKRNYGQHNALLAGIRTARFSITVTLDDDLQNPPEEIPKLLAALDQGEDVVYGKPVEKSHGAARNLAGRLVVRSLGMLGGRSAPMVSSFRAFRTCLADAFDSYVGPDVSVDALLTWATDSFTSVPVEHHLRSEGRSNYSVLKLFGHAFTMITAFSTKPLRLATTLGFLFTIVGALLLVYVIGRLLIEGDSVQGFPFLASVIITFSGVQFFALGLIGEYLARMHMRLMARPSFVIREMVGSEGVSVRQAESPGEGVGEPPAGCKVLPWDSRFWGFPIGTVGAERLEPETALAAGIWAREQGIRCLYLLAGSDDRPTASAAQQAGFRYVDSRLTLSLTRPASADGEGMRVPPGAEQPADGPEARVAAFEIGPIDFAEEAAVISLAGETQDQSRFFFDPGFPQDRAEGLYEEWARRGLATDDRDISVARSNGAIVGYLVRRFRAPDCHEIELIGVAPAARRSGCGLALIAFAKAALPPAGRLVAVTQGRNVAALAMYEKSGLRVSRSQTWFHLWP